MLIRRLPKQFFDNTPAFLKAMIADPELHPEIRNNSLTVYYRGAALIRDLRVSGNEFTASVNYKYIPIRTPERPSSVPLVSTNGSLDFDCDPHALAIGQSNRDVLTAYKRMIRSVHRSSPECKIVHEIVCRTKNLIVDQEIEFQQPGESSPDKIDICHYDSVLNCLAFVEVKGLHDGRLYSKTRDLPEVVDQLRRYRERIAEDRKRTSKALQNVVAIKRQLGLKGRLKGVPANEPLRLLRKPVLLIGDCTRSDVQQIINGRGTWKPLVDALGDEAAGLILCGKSGGDLDLSEGRQKLVFDTACD
jgi:hypothetical protein